MVTPQRVACVWCPDWPVVASGIPASEPGVVLHANRVIASSMAARTVGVVRGLRRREAQSRCPELIIAQRDIAREVRAFEEVAFAIQSFTPRLELAQAGTCLFPTRGPSRYFGGDHSLGAQIFEAVTDIVDGHTTCHVGIADGVFAARLAARRRNAGVRVIDTEASPEFLAPLAINVLDQPRLTDVLGRLGISTLGAFAELDASDVLGRFGNAGLQAHRQASGFDEQRAEVSDPPQDMEVSIELDPPVGRIDQAAFAARHVAVELQEKLERRGAACSRITVIAESEHDENFVRSWRHEGALSVGAMTDRVRWQLDGWLQASPQIRPSGGLSRLALRPDDLIAAGGRQLGFWGGETEADQRAGRAVARLESLLGPNHVQIAEVRGGREPIDRIELLPASSVDLAKRRVRQRDDKPWPGHLPAPSPAELFTQAEIELVDAKQRPVEVNGRGDLSGTPVYIRISGSAWKKVVSWAGPWLLDERWWDIEHSRRRARFQVVDEHGEAVLIYLENRCWWLAGVY